MKDIAKGKRRAPENHAPKIEVVPGAPVESPSHRRQQMQGLGEMSQNNGGETDGSEQLQERG